MTTIEILHAELLKNQMPLYCTRKELCDAVDEAEEAIRVKEKFRWIPVGEKLPKEFTDVLVSTSEGIQMAQVQRGEWKEWAEDIRDLMDWLDLDGVTYWMPLPDIPEK